MAYQITYVETDVPAAAGTFHAQYRRASTAERNPYVILDGVKGQGRYVGTFLAWTQMEKGWFGEGEIKFYLDGDDRFPTICGTGTEDYFLGSYGFPRPYTTAYAGTVLPASRTLNRPTSGASTVGTFRIRSISSRTCGSPYRPWGGGPITSTRSWLTTSPLLPTGTRPNRTRRSRSCPCWPSGCPGKAD